MIVDKQLCVDEIAENSQNSFKHFEFSVKIAVEPD